MHVSCSNCNSNYSLSDKEVEELNYSILPCKKCDKHIKIAICPHCSAFYSITFSDVKSNRYSLKCRKCENTFAIEFPNVEDALSVEENQYYDNLKNETIEVNKFPNINENEHEEKREQETLPSFIGKTISGFNLKELFQIAIQSFTIQKISIASVFIVLILLTASFSGFIDTLFFSGIGAESSPLYSMISLVFISFLFFLFVLATSVISRITLENIFHNKKLSFFDTIKFISHTWLPVLVSNIFLLLLFNSIFILFGKIPILGPVIFAILFLPVYIISMTIVFLVIIGFWFYPPISAHRMSGILKNVENLYYYVKKHNFSLLYVIPILAISTGVIFSFIYLMHYSAFSLTTFLSGNIIAEDAVKTFSAIPASFMKISDFSLVGLKSGIMKSLMGNISLSYHIGGVIIGAVLSVITILLFASYISLIGTLSTHVYIMMERGVDYDDSKKIRLLTLLMLLLVCILIFKKIFF